MLNKQTDSKVKLCIVVLLALSLFVPACKKGGGEASDKDVNQVSKKNGDAGSEKTQPEEMVVLEFELPKPIIVGTPPNIQVPKLEPDWGMPRPPFYAPAETKNVAFGKTVISSDGEPIIGELAMITDGDKKAAEGSYVELAPFLQSITIDFGSEYNIYAILLWHYHKQPRVYFDVIVQVADDSGFTKNVKTLFNNDHDNSAALGAGEDMHYVENNEGKLIDAKGVRSRYLRLYSNGNSSDELNHYTEVEVFGKPAK